MQKNIVMTMLGPEAVGKTTLLATMYNELAKIETTEHGFHFAAANDTGVDLETAYQKLSQIIEKQAYTHIGQLLPGTAGIIERQFEISFQDKKELDLSFYDIAGGLLLAKEDNKDIKEFKGILAQAAVIINVIDGAALVEGSLLLSDSINQPTRVRDLLRPGFTQSKQKRLVLFVITKCETWLKDEQGQKKLQKAFETRHKPVLNFIEERSNVVGVLIPVKTLGCVEFSRIEGRGEDETIVFTRRPHLEFSPEKVDQPLRYALAFALLQHDKNRSGWSRFASDWLSNKGEAFQESLIWFANGRDRNFKAYGKKSLIDVI
ncbi:MAG TPA: hypothetical protein ENG03_09040 [Thioploca sp.]|nr:hypothetical protein [Thioploca sp.]